MKRTDLRRVLCLLLSIVLLAGLLTGCGSRERGSRREETSSRRTEAREKETKETRSRREEKKEEDQDEARQISPVETKPAARKDNELPSFLKFASGSDFKVSQFDTHDGYYSVSYKSGKESDLAYAEDYISMMLDEENCEIVVEDGKERDDWYLKKLLLDHPCDASKHRMDALDDFWDNKGDLFLKINYYKDEGEVYFNIVYSGDLELADGKDAPSGGGGNSLFGKDCTWCGGDGRCNECGGDGRVYNWMPGTTKYIDQNCTNCNMGRCRQCGGDGKD